MTQIINSLPFHPIPKSKDSICRWIERLARANKIKFHIMLGFIGINSKEFGFFKALNKLTGIPITKISKMKNCIS